MVRRVSGLLLRRFSLFLGMMLGLMQVMVAHWVLVVFGGLDGLGLVEGFGMAALLVAANGTLYPGLRRLRSGSGASRVMARAYTTIGLATILVGLAVLMAWVGVLPLRGMLALAGVGPEVGVTIFRAVSLVVVFALAGMLLWGFTGGQAQFDHSHVRVPLQGLDEDLRGLRILHLSDLHIGNGLEGQGIDGLVERANRLEPDLIAITGDMFDWDPRCVEDGARRLGKLQARLGVYAVLGNHDTYTGTEVVAAALDELAGDLQLLRGEIVRVPTTRPLYIAGVDDPGRDWTARGMELPALDELAASKPLDGPVVLLVHRPEAFSQASRLGFPLVLAGHTHGGQIALPTPGGRYNIARLITGYDRGLFRENGAVLYVSRGVGVAGPSIRFNCTREIPTIELVPKTSGTPEAYSLRSSTSIRRWRRKPTFS